MDYLMCLLGLKAENAFCVWSTCYHSIAVNIWTSMPRNIYPDFCQYWQDDFRRWLCFEKYCQIQFSVQKLSYWELTAAAAVAADSSSAIWHGKYHFVSNGRGFCQLLMIRRCNYPWEEHNLWPASSQLLTRKAVGSLSLKIVETWLHKVLINLS